MSKVLVVSTGYKPRKFQAEIHKSLKRFNVLVCHRRFGKTHLSINELIDRALNNQLKNPQYAYLAPTYAAAERIAWNILKEYTKAIPGITTNEQKLRLEIERPHMGDKITIWLLGAENPDAIRGIYLDGVILDEFAEMNPTVWTTVVRPALSDRKGWAIFIGTPKGQNHFYELYIAAKNIPQWFCAVYKASQTGVLDTTELESARLTMNDSEYAQEFECSFSAALVGAYYGKEIEEAEEKGRITDIPYEYDIPVDIAFDLGVDDATSIWFCQAIGREIRIIDYYEVSGKGLPEIVKDLKEKPYIYGRTILPHDAAVTDLSTGKTRVETFRNLGLRNIEILDRLNVADGINAARLLLKKCYFDRENTALGLKALKNYERKWDAKNKVYQSRPLHNWASHAADAFRYLALGLDERRPSDETMKLYPRESDYDYDPY